jgi:DNA-3-methyladenine glycosylase
VPGSADALVGDVLAVAPRLLNAVMRHRDVAVRITEVEAYDGPSDPGSHAFNGQTRRNAVMFGPPGRLYVYFTYGMHHCCNITVGPVGVPSAVLVRAGEVVDGLATARARRGRSSDRDLARGPARLCQALAIDLSCNGVDLSSGPVTLSLGDATAAVRTGPRVGLRQAAQRPWRFWLDGDATVSTYRPAAVRRPGAEGAAQGR